MEPNGRAAGSASPPRARPARQRARGPPAARHVRVRRAGPPARSAPTVDRLDHRGHRPPARVFLRQGWGVDLHPARRGARSAAVSSPGPPYSARLDPSVGGPRRGLALGWRRHRSASRCPARRGHRVPVRRVHRASDRRGPERWWGPHGRADEPSPSDASDGWPSVAEGPGPPPAARSRARNGADSRSHPGPARRRPVATRRFRLVPDRPHRAHPVGPYRSAVAQAAGPMRAPTPAAAAGRYPREERRGCRIPRRREGHADRRSATGPPGYRANPPGDRPVAAPGPGKSDPWGFPETLRHAAGYRPSAPRHAVDRRGLPRRGPAGRSEQHR